MENDDFNKAKIAQEIIKVKTHCSSLTYSPGLVGDDSLTRAKELFDWIVKDTPLEGKGDNL
jgi:hypothetical protein